MGTSTVTIHLTEDVKVVLTTDAPNIQNLVDEIASLRNSLNPDDITVACDSEGFDSNSFREVIVDSARDFLDAIKLDQEKLERVKAQIEDAHSEPAN